MIKTIIRVLILIFIIALIAPYTVSIAEQYSTVQGKALDKNGNPIAGVKLTLYTQDITYKTIIVGSMVTDSRGLYIFDNVAVPSKSGLFQIAATFNANNISYSSGSPWFEVDALMPKTQDVTFDDYPPASERQLYGTVSKKSGMIVPVGATVYISNGMYTFYGGGSYDQWSFSLPVGDYVVWAERNVNNVTYVSERYNAHVASSEDAFLPIVLDDSKTAPYHQQPLSMKNTVYGTVLQKNGMPLPDVRVDLCRANGSQESLANTITNASGQYVFYNVNVNSVSSQYVAKLTFELNGETHVQASQPFTMYYANTIGVKHDYSVPVKLDVVNSGGAMIQSTPSSATVWIDGSAVGKTPYNATGLKTGQHNLGLTMGGFYPDNSTFQVLPDEITEVSRSLKSSTGDLSLEITPADASVYIDGNYAGLGSQNLSHLGDGQHSYLVTCDGYRNESGTIDIISGQQMSKKIDMVAVPGLSLTYIAYLINNMFSAIGSIFSGGR